MKSLPFFLLLSLLFYFNSRPTNVKTKNIYQFSSKSSTIDWQTLNDGVMGGISSSTIKISDSGTGLFEGTVKLENNGGFASIRNRNTIKKVDKFSAICLRVKGDGKRYQFRVKKNVSDYYSYIKYFNTTKKWETIEIPLNSLEPSFRGRKLKMKNFSNDKIEEISFLIANYKKENFRLEIDKIYLK